MSGKEIPPEVAYVIAKDLKAEVQPDGKSVILSWLPPPKSGLVIIARSRTIIDAPEKLYVADSLGKYPSGTENGISSFSDPNLAEGDYYYAIILVEQVKKREVTLIPGQNFTVAPVTIRKPEPVKLPETKPEATPAQNLPNNIPIVPGTPSMPPEPEKAKFVTGLTIEREGNALRLYWNTPVGSEEGSTSYQIYRSTSPMSNLPLMQKAVKLAELAHPEASFIDQELDRSGTYYYGVAVKHKGVESLPLTQDISFKRYFYIFNKEKQEIEQKLTEDSGVVPEQHAVSVNNITNIRYEAIETGVRLAWDPPANKKGAVIYTIYESSEPFNRERESFNPSKSKILGRVFHPQTFFKITDISPERDMFYAVTVRSENQEEGYKIYENESFIRLIPSLLEKKTADLVRKEEVSKHTEDSKPEATVEDKDHAKDAIDLVLLTAYKRGKYSETIYRLQNLLEEEKDSHLRGKMNFYIGLSYFHKREYNIALKYMLKPETKLYDNDRTDFWTKRCLSQIARGKQ